MAAEAAEEDPGRRMHRLISELFPVCRSITGDGVRETLRRLQREMPLEIHEVASGTPVFDWTVPKEWNIRDAWIKDATGRRVVDFRACNLHVVGYSVPVRARMSLAELRPHLHSDPEKPGLVPYRTSYYRETWGFCLAHDLLAALPEGEYEVCIDSSLEDGALTWGEVFLPGESGAELLVTAHVCHPSLANDNLSGIAVAVELIRGLMAAPRRLGLRVVFAPATIGAIAWLALNEAKLPAVRHVLVAANLGDPGPMHYKRSRAGDAPVDRAAAYVLAGRGRGAEALLDFEPYGYDERQFNSPGIGLDAGCLMRSPHGRFPEYHTSADDLGFVTPAALAESLAAFREILDVLEADRKWLNLSPKCEPQLGRRGLYDALGGRSDAKLRQMAMLWVLNFSDGRHSLLDIAGRSGIAIGLLAEVAGVLAGHGLLAEAG